MAPPQAGERLDLGAAALSGLPRRRVRALLAAGRVWLNGRATRVLSRRLQLGDAIDIIGQGEELATPIALPPPAIVHEDSWLIAIDKPAGVASQPPRQRAAGELTVQEQLLMQLAWRDGRRGEVLLLHRLDRLTTGVLVFARHHDAARALARAWAAGRAEKRYLAVVRGDPGADQLSLGGAIAPDPALPGRFRVARGGRPARTDVRRLAAAGGFALLEVRPLTGRSHQVRVHLAAAGCPVAGDTRYGGGRGGPRPFLHAWRLTLPHPADGAPLRLTAPLPADMSAFLAAHGLPRPALETQR